MNLETAAVIPARYNSTRFPGKPLCEILDKPMIVRVVESACEADLIDEIYVATDDKRIKETVEKTPATAIMTSTDIKSGTDRVARVARNLDEDVVVNIQGDEPLIKGSDLDRGISSLESSDAPMASFMVEVEDMNKDDSDVVKVVVDESGEALYFSRAPIPFSRDDRDSYYIHVGIYFFERDYLLEFNSLDQSTLEFSEDLEQLRALENGNSIKMIEISEATAGVDRPEDINKVEKILKGNQ